MNINYFYFILFCLTALCSSAFAEYSMCPKLQGYAVCQNGNWQLVLDNKPDAWPIDQISTGSCTQEGERHNNVLFQYAFYSNEEMNCHYEVLGSVYRTDMLFSLKSTHYTYVTNSEINPSLWQKNYSSNNWICPWDGQGGSSPELCPIKSKH